ncbi:TetR/AcrR family transcriptional regulator [Rhodococcus gannanensis]|uniref:TetR/AcrR family transcriptional regulator n=1 Tax=Rhodococcus gannanensis TaxID=1960308 RepID=A0ABW4P6C1_9NOCA
MARQDSEPKRQRRERGSINPDDIVAGAFELAEQVTLDNLSMPMLGKHLGVGVTSIYWYFRKKDDLLNEMTDRAVREHLMSVEFPEVTGWRDMLATYARTMRATFLANPILIDLILIRSTLSPKHGQIGAQQIEQVVAGLVAAGLPLADAYDTFSAVQLHVRGFVVLARLGDKARDADPNSHAYYEDLEITPENTPLLAEATALGNTGGVPDDRNFEYGLECILDHAAARLDATAGSAKRTTRRRTKSAGA